MAAGSFGSYDRLAVDGWSKSAGGGMPANLYWFTTTGYADLLFPFGGLALPAGHGIKSVTFRIRFGTGFAAGFQAVAYLSGSQVGVNGPFGGGFAQGGSNSRDAVADFTVTFARPIPKADLHSGLVLRLQGTAGEYAYVNSAGLDWTSEAIPAPVAVATAADQLTKRTARLNGTIDTDGYGASWWFEWGLTTDYGSVTPETAGGAPVNPTAVSATISELVPGQTYHFRLAVKNTASGVITRSADQVVTTYRGGQQILL